MNRQFPFDGYQNKIRPDLKIYEGRKAWNSKITSPKSLYTNITEKEKYQEFL